MTRIGLLFDLDGTLVHTDPLHHAAFAAILAERGRGLSFEEYRDTIMGKPNIEIMARHFPDVPDEHTALADRKEAMFREALGARVEPVAGIAELLDWAEAVGADTAVVTNAPRENALAMLSAAGLDARLVTLVIGDECARPKPDPLPYITAMRMLGVTPSQAVAFEDSPSGLRAARGSGAHVFGMTGSLGTEALRAAGAHQVIADFTDPALWAHLETLRTRVA